MTDIEVEYIASEVSLYRSSQIVAHVLPENATDKGLVYRVLDSNLSFPTDGLKVSPTGLMVGMEPGDYFVEIDSNGNPDVHTDPIPVRVVHVLPESIEVAEQTNINIGDTYQIEYTVLPENASIRQVTFSLKSGDSVSFEPSNGTVTGVSEGISVINVRSLDDQDVNSDTIIKVSGPPVAVESFELDTPGDGAVIYMPSESSMKMKFKNILPANANTGIDAITEASEGWDVGFSEIFQDGQRVISELGVTLGNVVGDAETTIRVWPGLGPGNYETMFNIRPYERVTRTSWSMVETLPIGIENQSTFNITLQPSDSQWARNATTVEIVPGTGDAMFVNPVTGNPSKVISGEELYQGGIAIYGVTAGDFVIKVTTNSGTFNADIPVTVTE